MKQKKYYYVDRYGNYHTRARQPQRRRRRRRANPYPLVGALLALLMVWGLLSIGRPGPSDAVTADAPAAQELRAEAVPSLGADAMEEEAAEAPEDLDEAPEEEPAEEPEGDEPVPEEEDEPADLEDEGFRAVDLEGTEAPGAETPTAEPTPEPAPEPTAEPTAEPELPHETVPLEEPGDAGLLAKDDPAYLPLAAGVPNAGRKVAIVIEGSEDPGNLWAMLQTLFKARAKVTLCPSGATLGNAYVLRSIRQALRVGMLELEATEWGAQPLYQMSDETMAQAIWWQGRAMNSALGVRYQPHFYRMRDGKGELDQRAHDYLDQLGYRAVLHGTVESWSATDGQMASAMRPGAVLLFRTSASERKRLERALAWLVGRGAQMVTLNELYGLPANATAPAAEETMPQPRTYLPSYRTLRKGDYAYRVQQMQARLKEMGMLGEGVEATGYYGDQTARAIQDYQEALGLESTGEADPETQRRLLEPEGDGLEEAAPEA